MSKPLHLLAVIEATSITGPAKNLIEFARLARPQNVKTSLVTFSRGPAVNVFTSAVLAEGIPLEIVQEKGPLDLSALRSLRAVVSRLQPDVIQTHAVKSHFLARAAGLHRIAPWVAFHHGYTWPDIKARAYNQLDRWSLRAPRQILTVSRPFRDELVSFGVAADRIAIIHNAIATQWGRRGATAIDGLSVPPGRKVILIVGRLSREKDHLTLLRAVSRLSSEIDLHLVIVGEGPERMPILEESARLNMTDRVTLTGQQSSAEPWYAVADVAVLSSLSEGSPNALLEAMSANVPVVATAVGGIPEIVTDNESALLVPPADVIAMENAIRRILTDSGLAARLTSRSQQLVAQNHDPEARVRRLVSIYRSLAS